MFLFCELYWIIYLEVVNKLLVNKNFDVICFNEHNFRYPPVTKNSNPFKRGGTKVSTPEYKLVHP